MDIWHAIRLAIISSVIIAEALLPDVAMILIMSAAAISCIVATQRQMQRVERRAFAQALCRMKREIIAACGVPRVR